MVNQNRIGPRLRGFASAAAGTSGATGTGVPGAAGTKLPVAGSGTCGTGGAVRRRASCRGRGRSAPAGRPARPAPAATGSRTARRSRRRTSSAEIAPTPISAMEPVAVVEVERGARRAVLGDQQPAGAVQQQPGAAEEDEHHEGDPQDDAGRCRGGGPGRRRRRRPCGPRPVVRRIRPRSRISSRVARDPWALWSAPSPGRPGVARSGRRVEWWSWHQPASLGGARHHRGRP